MVCEWWVGSASSRECEVRCIAAGHGSEDEGGGDAWRWLYGDIRAEGELRGGRVFTLERDALTGGRWSWEGGGRWDEWKSCWRTDEYGGPWEGGSMGGAVSPICQGGSGPGGNKRWWTTRQGSSEQGAAWLHPGTSPSQFMNLVAQTAQPKQPSTVHICRSGPHTDRPRHRRGSIGIVQWPPDARVVEVNGRSPPRWTDGCCL